MKREVVFAFVFIFFLLSISLISAATEETQVAKAYSCLEEKTNTSAKCAALSFEGKVFSLLANGNCLNETRMENLSTSTSLCWPKSSCNIKSTAEAVLALNVRYNTTKAENWLLAQTAIPTSMDWFLEIETAGASTCKIGYQGPQDSQEKSYTISILENKTITSNAGTYLTLAQNSFWLKISPSIYNKNIDIFCDKGFMTTLLFMKQGSTTIHVSGTPHSASLSETTTEKVDSFCFSKDKVNCDYEGSLWATLVLYSLKDNQGNFKYGKEGISKFMPYVITMKDDVSNQIYLPESFLYSLTGKFELELLSKQVFSKYWEVSADKFYDTSLALWPLLNEDVAQKKYSKSWLLENQQDSGCWNDGVRDTAFILYSVWPKSSGLCHFDSDCPEIDCKQSSCNYGTCSYSYNTCGDEDGCCNIGCTSSKDNDCTSGQYVCEAVGDCTAYSLPDEATYCSDDKTKVLKDTPKWICPNKVCDVSLTPKIIETCSSGKQCFEGSCILINDIPDNTCIFDSDCQNLEDTCVNGVCTPPESLDCESENYYCMSQASCDNNGGNILENYNCVGLSSCCDTPIPEQTCADQGGTICGGDEICTDGTIVTASNTVSQETCCADQGTCEKEQVVTSDCIKSKGTCKASCGSNEEKNSYYCGSGESCCVAKSSPSYLWIWILSILILLSVLGIVFRDKLRAQWMMFKDKFGAKKEKKKFVMPLVSHPNLQGRILPRRIFPPQQSRPPMRGPAPSQHPIRKPEEKTKNDLDDVLKKLKEMGK